MKSRYINTKFWSDPFVGELDPYEKLLFLYFLTNQHTNISGVYELALKVASFETGIPQTQIEDILTKFEEKIIYHHGYVVVKNFYKHQQKNVKIDIGIAAALKELPAKILSKLQEIGYPVKELLERGKAAEANFSYKYKDRRYKTGGLSKALD